MILLYVFRMFFLRFEYLLFLNCSSDGDDDNAVVVVSLHLDAMDPVIEK